jgi:ATP-binding cassette, subfamily B, bacterial HlyB/CyaB
MQASLPLSAGAITWALGSLCRLHRIPFDAKLLLSQFSPPYTLASLQNAASTFGFKVGFKKASHKNVSRLAFPCLGILKPKSNSAEACSLALLVNADAQRVLHFQPGSETAQTTPAAEFTQHFEPQVLTFDRKLPPVQEENVSTRRFGFSWFIPELLKHKRIWRDVLAASLFIQLMALATPLFTQVVIDKVIVHHTQSTLVVIAIGLSVFLIFTAALSWVRQYLVLHTGNRVDAVLGSAVFEHLFRLPLRYFEHRPTGTLIARILGVETIREFISGAIVMLVLDLPFLLLFLAVMIYYSWQLTVIATSLLLVMALLSFAITPVLRKRLNVQFLLGARNQAFLTEYVSGMETVKSLSMEPRLQTKFEEYLASYLSASFNTRKLSTTYNVTIGMLEQLLTLAILCVGAWMVMNNPGFTIGMLVAFQMFTSRLTAPVLRLAGLWQEFQQAAIAVKRLGDVMDAPQEPYALIPSREAMKRGQIEIRNLSFRYAEDRPFLYRDFSLKIEPGALVAIMGASGCGKSTLAKLLQGFYQLSDGRILVDGCEARYFSVNELRGYFGIVPQETVLFSGTIYDNLILANPHVSFEQMIQACKMAEIHETIEVLPQGYQTEIGEHGAGLSGGQKQRIAIARALLKQPLVLIFDEALSHLDPTSASQVARTINRLKAKVTMLFIAHQLPLGLQVDQVVKIGSVAVSNEPG